jgi:hypothetical protein
MSAIARWRSHGWKATIGVVLILWGAFLASSEFLDHAGSGGARHVTGYFEAAAFASIGFVQLTRALARRRSE